MGHNRSYTQLKKKQKYKNKQKNPLPPPHFLLPVSWNATGFWLTIIYYYLDDTVVYN